MKKRPLLERQKGEEHPLVVRKASHIRGLLAMLQILGLAGHTVTHSHGLPVPGHRGIRGARGEQLRGKAKSRERFPILVVESYALIDTE